jgi:hypothetical protein
VPPFFDGYTLPATEASLSVDVVEAYIRAAEVLDQLFGKGGFPGKCYSAHEESFHSLS